MVRNDKNPGELKNATLTLTGEVDKRAEQIVINGVARPNEAAAANVEKINYKYNVSDKNTLIVNDKNTLIVDRPVRREFNVINEPRQRVNVKPQGDIFKGKANLGQSQMVF